MEGKTICPDFEEYVNKSNLSTKSITCLSTVDFAHPVDATIIKVLDNKVINNLFSKYVDATVDLTSSLELSTGFKIDAKSNPELYAVIVDCAEKLNISVPYTVISRSVPGINASTSGTDKFAYIAISSLITMLFNDEELRFVLGHECGHIALGHVVYHTAVNTLGQFGVSTVGKYASVVGTALAKTIQYPLNAWSRRSEISADRAGLICCGDINVAKKALLKLEAGFMNIDNIDIDAYLENSKKFRDRAALGKFMEIFNSHPIIPKRIEALDLFAHSEKYYRIMGAEYSTTDHLLNDQQLEEKTNQIIKVIL